MAVYYGTAIPYTEDDFKFLYENGKRFLERCIDRINSYVQKIANKNIGLQVASKYLQTAL